MAEFPALPLWTDAYLADCSHLSFAEHGAYLNLLLLMWRSPDCRIPNDDDWIMRKLRCDADAMRTHVHSVMREFCTTDGNWLTQKRLQKEWQWCRDKRKKNTEAAKHRWGKDNQESERSANGHANAMPPSHTLPTPKKKEKEESISAAPQQALALVDDPVLISLPTNKTKLKYCVLQSHFDQFQSLYPAVDVAQELRAMAGWLMANPKNAKTLSGMPRFINAWLAKNQNRSVPNGHGKPNNNDTWLAGAADLAAELRSNRG